MATVAQADWPADRTVELKSDRKAEINWWLGTVLSATHEVSERKGFSAPLKHFNFGGWKSSCFQFGFDLTGKR